MGIEEINKTLSNYVIWCEEQNRHIPEDVKKAILVLNEWVNELLEA